MSGEASKKVRGDCKNCGEGRWADVRAEYVERESDTKEGFWAETRHLILVCRGCDFAYHQTRFTFSEDVDYFESADGTYRYEYNEKIQQWPQVSGAARPTPKWIGELGKKDLRLEELLRNVYQALDAGLPIMATFGVRIVFDRATELLDIDAAITFQEKLKSLLSRNYIGESEFDMLKVVVDVGNAAAHRGWSPSPLELGHVLDVLESFINRVFLTREKLNELKNAIPQRPARRTAAP